MASTAITPTHLPHDTFANKVLEDGLATVEANGYIYARGKGAEKDVLFRTYGPKWAYLYQARRVATQTNAGGGAITIDITIASGMTAQLVNATAINSGNNGLNGAIIDEDNANAASFATVGAAAGTSVRIPSIGSASTGSNNMIETLGLRIGPGQKLTFAQSAAGAQNDTLTEAITLLLPITAASDGSDVSWSVARSTNAGDVTLADSTISTANTMQAVLLP